METEVTASFKMHSMRSVFPLSGKMGYLERLVVALESSVDEDPNLSFDISKSLVESVCKTVLLDRGEAVDNHADLPKLFKSVLKCLQLVPEETPNARQAQEGISKALNGLLSSVYGLCDLRNSSGAVSHGKDAYSVSLDPIHARLAAQAADTITWFIYTVHIDNPVNPQKARLRYEEQESFNLYVDELHEIISIFNASWRPSHVLFELAEDSYREALIEFNASEIEEK